MERNTVERATKTEIDARTEQKGVGKLASFTSLTSTATFPPRKDEPVGTTAVDSFAFLFGRREQTSLVLSVKQTPMCDR